MRAFSLVNDISLTQAAYMTKLVVESAANHHERRASTQEYHQYLNWIHRGDEESTQAHLQMARHAKENGQITFEGFLSLIEGEDEDYTRFIRVAKAARVHIDQKRRRQRERSSKRAADQKSFGEMSKYLPWRINAYKSPQKKKQPSDALQTIATSGLAFSLESMETVIADLPSKIVGSLEAGKQSVQDLHLFGQSEFDKDWNNALKMASEATNASGGRFQPERSLPRTAHCDTALSCSLMLLPCSLCEIGAQSAGSNGWLAGFAEERLSSLFQLGSRLVHPQRGPGTVLRHTWLTAEREPAAVIRFDRDGSEHRYASHSFHKLSPLRDALSRQHTIKATVALAEFEALSDGFPLGSVLQHPQKGLCEITGHAFINGEPLLFVELANGTIEQFSVSEACGLMPTHQASGRQHASFESCSSSDDAEPTANEDDDHQPTACDMLPKPTGENGHGEQANTRDVEGCDGGEPPPTQSSSDVDTSHQPEAKCRSSIRPIETPLASTTGAGCA